MAKAAKSKKHDENGKFKKGVSGNPKGRPKAPIEVRRARAMNKNELDLLLAKYRDVPVGELMPFNTFIQKNKDLPILHAIVLSTMVKAASGDSSARAFIADRMFGKVTDKVEVTEKSMHMHLVKYIENKTADE